MIDTKYAAIVAVAAFVSGTFVASPELRAYAAATIASADIVNETIMSEDIKNGQIKAVDIATGAVGSTDIFDGGVRSEDIATDAVGPDELQGVSRLLFAKCIIEVNAPTTAGSKIQQSCGVEGAHERDNVIATINSGTFGGNVCFVVLSAEADEVDDIDIWLKNDCSTTQTLGTVPISIIVFR